MGAKRKSAKRAKRVGRPPIVDTQAGRILKPAELARRWPGLTKRERAAVRRLVGTGPGQIPFDKHRWTTSMKLRTAYDQAVLRVLSDESGLPMQDLMCEAIRAWLRERCQ